MRSLVVAIATFLALSVLSCQDTRVEDQKHETDVALYRNIGHQIPYETGVQWMEYYQQQQGGVQGRKKLLGLGLFSYTISGPQVEAMTASVSDLVGVAFHWALDDDGDTHIIAIPIDPTLSLWSSIPGRIYVDANTGNPISQAVAQDWAQNYKDEHPTGIWFHFFGETVMDQILAIPYFNSMDIEPAINVLNLLPQMLLIVWNEDLLPFGRSDAERATIFDASNPCPPCACE